MRSRAMPGHLLARHAGLVADFRYIASIAMPTCGDPLTKTDPHQQLIRFTPSLSAARCSVPATEAGRMKRRVATRQEKEWGASDKPEAANTL